MSKSAAFELAHEKRLYQKDGHSLSCAVGRLLVDFLFFGGDPPPCMEEGDVDASGAINIVDVAYLVNYIFYGGPAPPPCQRRLEAGFLLGIIVFRIIIMRRCLFR
jgi:hypothetical protein